LVDDDIITAEETVRNDGPFMIDRETMKMLIEEGSGGMENIHGSPLIYSEGIYSVEINDDLEEWEYLDALKIIRYVQGVGPFLGIAGNMLISGGMRQGKGLFGNTFAWKIKRYFKFKKVFRDDHPTELFGPYDFFNEDTVMEDIVRMSEAAEKIPTESKKAADKVMMSKVAAQWGDDYGGARMQNSIMLKDMGRRRGMSVMNLVLSGLMKTTYHIDMLICGIVQTARDLDRFSCLPWVNLHAKCSWYPDLPDTTRVQFFHVKWNEYKQRLEPISPTDKRPIVIYVNGGLPRKELGGSGYFGLFKSKSAPNLRSLGGKQTLADYM
jgi:hypothetical protein